jgi:hypothetical protein
MPFLPSVSNLETNDLTEKQNWRAVPGFAEGKNGLRLPGAEGH